MATSGMDALSKELHDFLCRLGEHPEQVSDKLQGYTQALLQLLTPADELLVKGRYGILGSTKATQSHPIEIGSRREIGRRLPTN